MPQDEERLSTVEEQNLSAAMRDGTVGRTVRGRSTRIYISTAEGVPIRRAGTVCCRENRPGSSRPTNTRTIRAIL